MFSGAEVRLTKPFVVIAFKHLCRVYVSLFIPQYIASIRCVSVGCLIRQSELEDTLLFCIFMIPFHACKNEPTSVTRFIRTSYKSFITVMLIYSLF